MCLCIRATLHGKNFILALINKVETFFICLNASVFEIVVKIQAIFDQ